MEGMVCLSKEWVYLALVCMVVSLVCIWGFLISTRRSYRQLNKAIEGKNNEDTEVARKR